MKKKDVFEVADVVVLKGHAVRMTVSRLGDDDCQGDMDEDDVECLWFDKQDQCQSQIFPISVIQLVLD